MGKVNQEIEEMLNALGDPTPEGMVSEEEEEQEDLEEKEEVEEKEEKEEKEEEELPPEEKEEEKKEEEEPEDKDKIIENLRAQLEERAKPEKKEEAEPKPKEEKEEKKDEPLTLEEHDFVGDLDLDDLTHDKDMFNKLLNAVYAKGVSDSKKLTSEGVLMTIPDIVKHNITLMTTLKEARDKFYDDNKDLSPFKAVVAAVFEEVAAKNSDKTIVEIMDLVAPEVRTRLQLKKQAVEKKEEKKEDKKDTPRLHGARSGNQRGNQREKPDTKGISSEIEAMNKALGRNN